jgi:hypothetical protein
MLCQMSSRKENKVTTVYRFEVKWMLVLKLGVKVTMVCLCYKDNDGVIMAEAHVLMVIMLK